MPTGLQKSVISFPLVKGVDSGESPVLVPPDQALGLQNMRFNRGVVGSLTKRYGYDAIASAPAGGTNLFTFQSNSGVEELDLIADGTLYAFAPATNAYQSRPGLTPAFTAAELPLAGSSINQANPDGCQAATATGVIGVYAWEQAGGLYYTVIDEAAGTVIQPVTLLSSNGGHPCVRNVNGSPVIFYSDSAGAVNAATFSVLTPASAPSVAAVSTGNRPSTPITAVVLGGFVFLACYGTIELQLLKLTPFAWSSTSTTLGVLGAGLVLCEGDASHLVLVTWAGNTNTVRVDGYSTALFHGGTNTATMPAGNIAQIATSVFLPGNTNFAVRVLVQTQVDGDANTTSIYKFTTSNLAAITFSGVQQLARSVGLASGPWQGNGDTYVLACFPDPTQGTDYILDGNTGVVVGKLLVGKGSALSTNEQLPQASQQGTAVTLALTSAILIQRTVTAQNTTTYTDTYGIVRLTTSTTPGTYSTAQAGLSALIATGTLLQQYDGSNVVEQGYNLIPATPTGSLASAPVQVVITQAQNGVPHSSFVALVAFPKNKNDGQALGSQLTELGIDAGDFITMGGNADGTNTAGVYFWYRVDGAGTDPAPGGAFPTGYVIDVTSQDTANQLAIKTAAVFNGNASFLSLGPLDAGGIPERVVLYEVLSTPVEAMPAFQKQFVVTTTNIEHGGNLKTAVVASCPPANLLQASQYFLFVAEDAAGVSKAWYAWIQKDGAGTDPKPGGYPNGIAVPIATGYTGAQVASELAAACVLAGIVNSGSAANQATIKGADCTVPTVFASYVASNPVVGGWAQGYLGAGQAVITPGDAGVTNFGGVAIAYDIYVYETIFQWTDAQAQVSLSNTSNPLNIVVPGFGSGQNTGVVDLTLPTLRLTQKTGVQLVLYRTQADSSGFQQVVQLANDATVNTLTTTDYTSDATLSGENVLYTSGNVLGNDGPPAGAYVTVINDRAWLATLEDPSLWWFSKEKEGGVGVEWSLDLTLRIDAAAGPQRAAAVMDGNVVLLGANQIYLLSGPGPNESGVGSWTGPTVVSAALGCRDPGSVLAYKDGVIFKSPKGIWALARSFDLVYIGLNVKQYNDDVIAAATIIPGETEIYFLTVAGTPLLWDYFYGQWSTLTNHTGVSACVYQNLYTYLRAPTTAVYQQTPGAWGDAGVPYAFSYTGPWWKGGDNAHAGDGGSVQGFKRVWEALVKGSFTGRNPLQVTFAVNYDPTQTYTPQTYTGPTS